MTHNRNTGTLAALALAMVLGGHGARAQTPIPPSPKDYAMAAAQGDQYQVLAARVALVEAKDPRVRAFAETMLRDHTRAADALRQAVMAAGLPPPEPGLSSDQAALLAGLQGLRGADFDKAYARQQVVAHAQAVAVEESFAEAGADPSLRKAAQADLPAVRDHLAAARQLRGEVGGS